MSHCLLGASSSDKVFEYQSFKEEEEGDVLSFKLFYFAMYWNELKSPH